MRYIFITTKYTALIFGISCHAMEKPTITAHPAQIEFPTLKQLAITKFVNCFDPNNNIADSMLKRLKNRAHALDADLQAELMHAFDMQKADVLETINDAKVKQLSSKELASPW